MIASVLRSAGAVAAGLAVTVALAVAVEALSAVVHPFPEDFTGTPEEVARHVEHYPAWVLALVVPVWGLAAFAGAWTAGRLGNRRSALIVGVVIVAALVLNISMLPYPLWFKAACLIAVPAAIVCGARLSSRRESAGAGDAD
jgi:hypothetical protein